MRWPRITTGAAFLAMLLAASSPAVADSGETGGATWHGAITFGGFVAVTGPTRAHRAAEAVLYPGRWLDRYGITVLYRGLGSQSGMVAAGVSYLAGASRPRFTLALHGELGAQYSPARSVAGGGVRAQLTVWGPFVIAGNATGHFFYDGIDTRLALAITLSAGLAR